MDKPVQLGANWRYAIRESFEMLTVNSRRETHNQEVGKCRWNVPRLGRTGNRVGVVAGVKFRARWVLVQVEGGFFPLAFSVKWCEYSADSAGICEVTRCCVWELSHGQLWSVDGFPKCFNCWHEPRINTFNRRRASSTILQIIDVTFPGGSLNMVYSVPNRQGLTVSPKQETEAKTALTKKIIELLTDCSRLHGGCWAMTRGVRVLWFKTFLGPVVLWQNIEVSSKCSNKVTNTFNKNMIAVSTGLNDGARVAVEYLFVCFLKGVSSASKHVVRGVHGPNISSFGFPAFRKTRVVSIFFGWYCWWFRHPPLPGTRNV